MKLAQEINTKHGFMDVLKNDSFYLFNKEEKEF